MFDQHLLHEKSKDHFIDEIVARCVSFLARPFRYGARVGGPKNYAVNLILRLFLYHFFTYNELMRLRVHPQQHKQQTNTTTILMELLAPPAAWIQ
jgi:hypothetical protein